MVARYFSALILEILYENCIIVPVKLPVKGLNQDRAVLLRSRSGYYTLPNVRDISNLCHTCVIPVGVTSKDSIVPSNCSQLAFIAELAT